MDHADVTPSDTEPIPNGPAMGLFVGSGSTLVVTSVKGTDATYVVEDGTFVDVLCTHVKAQGLTAGDIVALF